MPPVCQEHRVRSSDGAATLPDEAPPPAAKPPRSAYFDLLRAAALLRVIVYHSLGLAWLTIAFPAVGVMFALAGSLMAASLDRVGVGAVGNRLRRLLPPVWMLAAVSVPAMVLGGLKLNIDGLLWLFPVDDPPANAWGSAALGMIWYLREYLWFVLLSPLALAAFRRRPFVTLLAPFALLALLELTGSKVPGIVSDLALYGDCWLLGFAHHDGMLRRIRASRLVLAAGVLGGAGAAWFLTHPSSRGYDLNDIPLGNALWSIAFLLVLMGLVPPGAVRAKPWLARLLSAVNGRAMTLYLWHQSAIAVMFVLAARYHVDLGGRGGHLLLLLGVLVLVTVAVFAFGWVEDLAARRRPSLVPGGSRPRRAPATELAPATA